MSIKIVNIKEMLYQGGVVVLVILLTVYSCNQRQARIETEKEAVNTSEFLEAKLETFKNKEGKWEATKKSLAGDKDQLEVLLSSYVDSTQQLKGLVKRYKKIAAAGNIRTVTKIDSIFIPFDRPIEFDFNKKFEVKDPWYQFTGRVHRSGLNINDVFIPNNMSFVLGIKKNGWFKPKTYSIDVVNSNPFIETTGADSYQFTESTKRFGVGPFVGIDFNGNAVFALGIQYGVIRF